MAPKAEGFRKRARVSRGPRGCQKQVSFPWRTCKEEYDRDVELLAEIPADISVAELEAQFSAIKKRREKEMEGVHAPQAMRAQISRAGRKFNLPQRASQDELRRDRELLEAVPLRDVSGKPISLEHASQMCEQVKKHRAQEIAKGCLQELSFGAASGCRFLSKFLFLKFLEFL